MLLSSFRSWRWDLFFKLQTNYKKIKKKKIRHLFLLLLLSTPLRMNPTRTFIYPFIKLTTTSLCTVSRSRGFIVTFNGSALLLLSVDIYAQLFTNKGLGVHGRKKKTAVSSWENLLLLFFFLQMNYRHATFLMNLYTHTHKYGCNNISSSSGRKESQSVVCNQSSTCSFVWLCVNPTGFGRGGAESYVYKK